MTSRWWTCVVLAVAVTGCRMFEPKRTPDGNACVEPGPAPKPPPLKPLPPGGGLPSGASQLVVGLCPETGSFVAVGVNVKAGSIPFLVGGKRGSQQAFFDSAHKAGVPFMVYTSPVKVVKAAALATVKSAAAAPAGTEDEGGTLDPCSEDWEIGDKPPEDPKDQGGAGPDGIVKFAALAWECAHAMDALGTTVPRTSTVPAPR